MVESSNSVAPTFAAGHGSLIDDPRIEIFSDPQAVPLNYEVPMKTYHQDIGDQRWEWWKQMKKLDPKFEWKMPVNFYGKVVDQADQPVQGAKVRFQWTDMSPTGTSERFTQSDEQGTFLLLGGRGKNLGVYVSKDGYHSVRDGRGAFVYAAFFDPNFIEPDPNAPVVFHLIKKQQAQPLVKAKGNQASTNWLHDRGPAK